MIGTRGCKVRVVERVVVRVVFVKLVFVEVVFVEVGCNLAPRLSTYNRSSITWSAVV